MNCMTGLPPLRKSVLRAVSLALMVMIFTPAGAEPVPEPTGKRLRVLVAENFPDGNVYIGAAAQRRTGNPSSPTR